MNVLLFVPGLLFLFSRHLDLRSVVAQLVGPGLGLQLLLGAPFLAAFPSQYCSKAFEMSRVFFHAWTVNWKFLPPEVFTSKGVAAALLAGHLGGLLWFAHCKWAAADGGLFRMLLHRGWLGRRATGAGADADSPSYIAAVLLVSNFVGVTFARTLHYQFYTWYFHSLPLLLWGLTDLPSWACLAVMGGIEYAFNVGDAAGAGTPLSSAVLQAAHAVLLLGLAWPAARSKWGAPPPAAAVPEGSSGTAASVGGVRGRGRRRAVGGAAPELGGAGEHAAAPPLGAPGIDGNGGGSPVEEEGAAARGSGKAGGVARVRASPNRQQLGSPSRRRRGASRSPAAKLRLR